MRSATRRSSGLRTGIAYFPWHSRDAISRSLCFIQGEADRVRLILSSGLAGFQEGPTKAHTDSLGILWPCRQTTHNETRCYRFDYVGIVVPIRRTEIDLRIIVPRTTAQHTVVFTDRLLLQVLTRSPRRRAGTVPTKSSKIKKVVFHRKISARFAVKESGSKRGEGKEPSRQTTHNETRRHRRDHAGHRRPDTKNGE